MKTPRPIWSFAVIALFLFLLFAASCGTLEVGIVSDTSPDRLSSTPSALSATSSRDFDATISALGTMNAYLATRMAAQVTPGPGLESTVSALSTINAYLATRVAARATPGPGLESTTLALATLSSYLSTWGPVGVIPTPDATFTPAPGASPTDGSAPYCRPAEASVDLSASATTLKVGQAVSVTMTLANGDASEAKLGLIQYSLEVRPAGVLTSDVGPVEHRLTLEPGQSDEAEFVLYASTPGQAMLTGLTSYEMHALDYSWGSWSGCRTWPLEIIVAPALDTD